MDFQGRSIRNSHKRGQLFDEGQHLMKSRFYPEFHSKSIMYPVQHSNTSYISRNKPDLWTTTPTSPKSFASTCTINPTALKSRSVSFTDHTSTGLPSLYKHPHLRSRMLSLPNIEDDVDLDAVEDAFVSPSLPSTSAAFQYGIYPQMLSTKPNMKAYTRTLPSRGWLEVSIDSTLPTSPVGISKNVFDLSPLETTLPNMENVTTKIPTDSSFFKRFLPDFSVLNPEIYSRKVFIGGLPPDIDQEEIRISFEQYGPVSIDWPHKIHSKSNVPPKGYAFLLFKEESSVHKLLSICISDRDKLFTYVRYVTAATVTKKKVQIRPWCVSDSYFMADASQPGDSHKAVFVGGVPRPLKASELAEVMTEKFGMVTFTAIDCDSDLKYPKGAACVIFNSHTSYIAAVSSRFMQLVFGSIEKKVELKPYILDDQLCDECHGIQTNGQPAPFFCGSVTCLKYYCEQCWATFHSLPGRQNHRPMFKDVFDREKFC